MNSSENKNNKYPCPCCGYLTYQASPDKDWGYICPVCFWENDKFLDLDTGISDANHNLTLQQARDNFISTGACEATMLKYVRKPEPDEIPQ